MTILTRSVIPATMLLALLLGWPGQPVPVIGLEAGHVHADEQGTRYTCSMHPMIVLDEPGSCPICGMDLVPLVTQDSASSGQGERKVKYWVAPMDPTYIREEPGKSPMGMDLVPVYEGDGPIGAEIRIDPVVRQNMGLRTAPVQPENLHRTIHTVGIVDYEEPRQYTINSKIDGWVEKLYIGETGRSVRKGEPLLEIYSPALVSAQQEFLLAVANHRALKGSSLSEVASGAGRLLEAARQRLKLWDISDRQIARIEKSGKVEKTLTLYAGYDGIVTHKAVQQGQYVKSGMELMQIADISRVWVFADIYEYELPWVHPGQDVEVILPFVGERTVAGRIGTVYPFVEAKTRTVKARIELDNADLALKPDMYVHVRIKVESAGHVLTIPAESVLYTGEQSVVFVALDGGRFEARPVQTGMKDDQGHIEVRQGLREGEMVVTSGQFMLDSESKLRAAVTRLTAPKQPASPAPEHAGDDLFEDDNHAKKDALDDLFN